MKRKKETARRVTTSDQGMLLKACRLLNQPSNFALAMDYCTATLICAKNNYGERDARWEAAHLMEHLFSMVSSKEIVHKGKPHALFDDNTFLPLRLYDEALNQYKGYISGKNAPSCKV